jgi:replicative DNA helicase
VNLEHEAGLLGCILYKPVIIDELGLSLELFNEPSARAVFAAITRARDKGLIVEEIALAEELRAAGQGQYAAFLASLEPWTAANAGHYADRLREAARLRALEPVLRDGLAGIAANKDSQEIADALESGLAAAIRLAPEAEDASAAALLPAYLRELERCAQERVAGHSEEIETGLPVLDSVLGPIRPGELVVVAARPGAGKTALALGFASHVAVDLGGPSAYFSLEMSRHEIFDRLLSARSRFTLGRLRGGRIGPNDYADILAAGEVLRAAPLAVYDGSMNLGLLRSRIRRESAARGLRLAALDYLGLLDLGVGGNVQRWERVGEATRILKLLALELRITVILCVQLNREADGREPSLGQLRDSGSIEQDADRVILLHRRNEEEQDLRPVSAIIAKNRHGPTGRADLMFDGPHALFRGEA